MKVEECTLNKIVRGEECQLNTDSLGFGSSGAGGADGFAQSLGSQLTQVVAPQILLPIAAAAAFGMVVRRLRN